MVCLIPLYACCEFFRQVKTLEDELHIATNNLRGLEIGEEKVSMFDVVFVITALIGLFEKDSNHVTFGEISLVGDNDTCSMIL